MSLVETDNQMIKFEQDITRSLSKDFGADFLEQVDLTPESRHLRYERMSDPERQEFVRKLEASQDGQDFLDYIKPAKQGTTSFETLEDFTRLAEVDAGYTFDMTPNGLVMNRSERYLYYRRQDIGGEIDHKERHVPGYSKEYWEIKSRADNMFNLNQEDRLSLEEEVARQEVFNGRSNKEEQAIYLRHKVEEIQNTPPEQPEASESQKPENILNKVIFTPARKVSQGAQRLVGKVK